MKIFTRVLPALFVALGVITPSFAQEQSRHDLGTASTFKQSLRTRASIGGTRESGKLGVLQVEVAPGKTLDVALNVERQDGPTSTTYIGTVVDVPNSNFNVQVDGQTVTGSIVLGNENESAAYTYTSNASGHAFVGPTPIEDVLCVGYAVDPSELAAPAGPLRSAAQEIVSLQSLPGAETCVYLDFDGELVENTLWEGGARIDAQPTDASDADIEIFWARVAEDFEPFDVNVTTDLAVFRSYESSRSMQCIITSTNFAGAGVVGVAYGSSFTRNDFLPCWVFSASASASLAASHEVGHTIGLSHDGRTSPSEPYYGGTRLWGPIMGNPFNSQITHWSKGDYGNPNNLEDDLEIITSNFIPYRADDHGDDRGSATALSVSDAGEIATTEGFIGSPGDIDFFSFSTGGGDIALDVQVAARGADLNSSVSLYGANGDLIDEFNGGDNLATRVETTLAAGDYFFSVDGIGYKDPRTDGYSDYGSMGFFEVSGNVTPGGGNPPTCDVAGGTIEGGPFEFTIDGAPDYVSGLSLSGDFGQNSTWVITDSDANILSLQPTLADVEGENFDEASPGTCLIWHLSFEDGLRGAAVGNNASELEGCFELSNSVSVTRTEGDDCDVAGGAIEGGPFEFTIDGEPDFVSGLSLAGNSGQNSTWVITDDQGVILGLPGTLADVEAVDFDGAGAGVCLIWHLSFEDGLQNAAVGNNASELEGCFELSNSISVTRTADDGGDSCAVAGGTIEGGPFDFTIDGEPDFVSGLSLAGNSGQNSTWVITDDQGVILGLPGTLADVEAVDFDGAGAGVCLIWHLSFEDGLQNAAAGNNAGDLEGCFELSNSISVTRTTDGGGGGDSCTVAGGTIEGGPFEFTIDGEPDFVSGLSLAGESGANSTWVITDDQGVILGLPGTLADVEAVDFDGAGAGVCLIWHLSFEDGLQNAAVGNNAGDLEGCFELSNSISVTRTDGGGGGDSCTVAGGTIEGGPFEFVIDGTPDFVSGLSLAGNSGANSTWVITDDKGVILGLPATKADVEAVDFDGAGAGVCLIWHLSFEDGLQNAAVGNNAGDLEGCFELSNSISVTRTEDGGNDDGVATLYEDCNYGGKSLTLGEGKYSRRDLEALGFRDNSLSAIKVDAGYVVYLYSGGYFRGHTAYATEDDPCFVDDRFNDVVSSVVVRKVSTSGNQIEAEDFTWSRGVEKPTSMNGAGGGRVTGIGAGDWIAFDKITFPTTSYYLVEYRVSSTIDGAELSLNLNRGRHRLGNVSIPNTGDADTYTTVTDTVWACAGTYMLGLYSPTGGWDIDWLRVTPINRKDELRSRSQDENWDPESEPLFADEEPVEISIFPNPVAYDLRIEVPTEYRDGELSLFGQNGAILWSGPYQDRLDVSGYPSGMYALVFKRGNFQTTKRFVKE